MTGAPVLTEMPRAAASTASPWYARRIPELDGLRGLAILLVLIVHCIDETKFLGGSRWLSYLVAADSLSWSGVDLFFVLSGFLIGGILLDARGSANYFKAFYARRAFRILPVYAAVVGAFYLCFYAEQQGWIPGSRWLYGPNIPWYAYVTFTQNFHWAAGGADRTNWLTPTWSLAVEEQFYLILPAVIWFLSGRRLLYFLGSVIVGAPFLRLFLDLNFSSGNVASFCLVPCRADALLLGVLAALLVRHQTAWESLKSHRRSLVSAWIVLLAGLCALIVFKQTDHLGFFMTTLGYSWLALFYLGLLLLALIQTSGWLGKILRNSWLKALGTISYGVYLIHKPVLGLVFGYFRIEWPLAEDLAGRLMVLSALAITLAVASISWAVFERPLLKIGHRIKYSNAVRPRFE
jgi:peptidoglycan/LPS O-acetylase OafA/YrhL